MMSGRARLALHGPVLTDGRDLGPTRIEIEGGRIAAVRPGGSIDEAFMIRLSCASLAVPRRWGRWSRAERGGWPPATMPTWSSWIETGTSS